jgi:hypothetical protein
VIAKVKNDWIKKLFISLKSSWNVNVLNGFTSNSLMCKWSVTHHWKAFNKEYNFASNLTSIKGLHTKLWASKVKGVLILGISRLPLGSPRTK